MTLSFLLSLRVLTAKEGVPCPHSSNSAALQGRRMGKVMPGRVKNNSISRVYITKSKVSSGNSSSVRRQMGRKVFCK